MYIYSDTTRKLACRLKMDRVKSNFHLNQPSIFSFFCVSIQRGIYLSIHIFVEVPVLEVSPFTPEASIVCSSYLMPGSIVKLQPMLPGIVKWMCLEHISQLGASLLFVFMFINTWIFLFLRFLKIYHKYNWEKEHQKYMKFKGSHVVVGFLLHKKLPVSLCEYYVDTWNRSDVMGMVTWFDAFFIKPATEKKPWLWASPGEVGRISGLHFSPPKTSSQHFRVASCDMI